MLSRAKDAALEFLDQYVANLIFPPVCLSCYETIDHHNALCPRCWVDIAFIQRPFCDRLGIPLPYDIGETSISALALSALPSYDRARVVAAYDDIMRKLIHRFKYGDRHESLPLFARWLEHCGREILETADLIVPVPLYPLRLLRRRFNQSSLLADAVSKRTGIPVDHLILKRFKQTRSQVGLTAAQRKQNVAGAFRIDQSRQKEVRGLHVVLVDDVITTGATAEACASTIRKSGARQIDILALARVVDPMSLLNS